MTTLTTAQIAQIEAGLRELKWEVEATPDGIHASYGLTRDIDIKADLVEMYEMRFDHSVKSIGTFGINLLNPVWRYALAVINAALEGD